MKDLLIDLVFTARPIWDKRHKNHHNRYILTKEWNKIAKQLNVEESEVRTHWRNLRQEFGKQLKKYDKKSGAETSDDLVISWPFFEKLKFLKDQFTARLSTENLDLSGSIDTSVNVCRYDNTFSQQSDQSCEDEQTLKNRTDNFETSTFEDTPPLCVTPQLLWSQSCSSPESVSRTGYRKRPTAQSEIQRELPTLQKEKLDLVKRRRCTDVNDEDVEFFNSLIPTVKKLSPRDKFRFRMKVQQLLYDMAFSEDDLSTDSLKISQQTTSDNSITNDNLN